MKNIKKIGLSALAGALAMTSAHAGALSVSGSMEISYTKGSNETTSNPLGQANDITLKASTELDNGVTVAYKNTSSDTTLTGDSELSFGNIMGGTLAMTSAGAPISGIDNKTPTAFKLAEAQVGSITDVNGGDGTYGIRYTLADVGGTGIKLDYMYFPVHGTGDATGDEGFSGGGHGSLDAHDVTLTGSVPGVDGLNIGAGYYVANYDVPGSEDERHEGTAYATYAYGPLTFGYQVGAVAAAGLGGVTYKNTYAGISYAVSDDLSISYNNTKSRKGGGAVATNWTPTTSDYDSISLSYSMGGMTINIADADCSNCSYTDAKSQDERTISMSIAF
jgi:outer membrane protein OmpU